ncbi:prolyl oligopeptidase family serine peptidase [Shewanella sp. 3B26]|uniref:Prolyl oligopeptidase family serine peptidase n=1 Tax=Shewanella zhuhaiensis TaxID=2919576 RepID=A0AAJ1BHU8_9GAMM|nr:prolyl oligopeptidase family serine peptidase [Shewanella zhuhaiensis]MCH4295032.1 prolyl oligopeptidase family serine peptidase [Shewanella zhuhaiensis]
MKVLMALMLTLVWMLASSVANAYTQLTIDDFVNDPLLIDAEFSPDGRYLAFIRNDGKSRDVIIRDFSQEGAPITGVLQDEFIRADSISWANNSRLIVNLMVPYEHISQLKKKAETDPGFDLDEYDYFRRSISMNIYCQDKVILLNHKNYNRRNLNLSKISNLLAGDDKHILMPAWGYDGLEIMKVDVYTGKGQVAFKGGARTYSILTDNNGQPTFRLDYYGNSRSVKVYEYTQEREWIAIDHIYFEQGDDDEFDFEGLMGIGKEGELIYRKRNELSGYFEIVKYKKGSKDKQLVAFLPGEDIYSPMFDSFSGEYLGYQVQRDLIRNVYLDKNYQAHYDKVAEEIGHNNFAFWASSSSTNRAVVRSSGADHLGKFYVYDFKSQVLTWIGNVHNHLIPENLGLPAKVNYIARDGQKLRMYLLFPPNYDDTKAYPMVVLPHGGPHSRDSASFDIFAQYMATRGYIVIQPNFRGSTGYGLEFEKAGYKQWGRLMQDDVSDAVTYMTKNGYADKSRVCIVGVSYGGYAALIGTIKTPELYRCGISINGVTHLKDQIAFDMDSAKINEDQIEEILYERIGHPIQDSKMLDDNSPALLASKVALPLLIIAGDRDQVVPIAQAEGMVKALKKSKKDFKFVELTDTGHNPFINKDSAARVFQEVDQFLKIYLGE